MTLPITFRQFASDPVKGLFFLVICAVVALYVENRLNYTSQMGECKDNIKDLSIKIELLEDRLKKSDSTLIRTTTMLELLTDSFE